jgi:3-oxoacyl-(acyl-carrier-protein) synthase/thioesterase domain-containing protein/acyl carrier protein
VIAGPEDSIALVGMAGRFPGATDPERLWENVLRRSSSVTRRTDPSGAVLWARGELDDVAWFDPAFFGMSPRDALVLDPQHRILLECAWEALEDAAVDGRKPIRRTAVFAGANYSGYRELLNQAGTQVSAVEFESGTDKDFLATTIAYRLGLQGPCMTVQTACSSSLVAIHLASQALLEYDADQALAGGVSIVLPHTPGWRFEPDGIHSVDGVCRPFDADANGTVMGDGAGMVVLRRLEDAVADGCRIYAVLRGSAVNNDGSRKIGYAAPSAPGQAEVIHAAQARAGIDPTEVSYIETHGTGTPLGERVEFQALVDVFASQGANGARCALGSAKGALGHLDVAAGVVGLIRVALALHHATLPGTVNHHRPHPDLRVEHTPFFVPRAPTLWNRVGPRRAGVSSFGVGGTNAHIVVEECPPGGNTRAHTRQTLISRGYQPRRYWPAPSPAPPVARSADADIRAPVEYRRAIWHEWAPEDRPPDRPMYSRIILLADPGMTGDSLYELFRSHGHHVVWAHAGANGDAGVTEHGIRPDVPQGIIRLLQPTTAPGQTLVVCAWALDAGEQSHRAYDALTALAAGWPAGDRRRGGLDVVLLTQGVYPVTGDEHGDPALAVHTGLARALSMEIPTIRIRVLDLFRADASALADAARKALSWHDEPVLVRRGRRWWHPVYEPVTRLSMRLYAEGAPPVSGVSVVLGVGQVGAAAARVLANAGGTVVLAARPGTGTERAAILGRELESAGTTVLVETCNVADPGQIDALLARLADRFGTLDRVVLAAGISGDRAYQPSGNLPSWQREDHFRIKVDGVAALGAASARYSIRRIILMSSLAGVLGGISLGPYSAAAAAMDCYAAHFDGPRTGWLSVGWDAWQHDDPTTSAHESRMVQDGLTPAEAEEALSQVLLSDVTGHILVVKGDFAQRWERFVRQPLHRAVDAPAATAATDAATVTDVPQLVLDSWRTCLANPALGLDDDLLQHGADSLNSIEVLVTLGERLGVTLPTDLIFEAQTPRLLATHIAGLLAHAHTGKDHVAVRRWLSTGPMIWCLHPISGSADCFGPLADLLDGHQVRAVVGQPLAEVNDEDSIESQASRYHGLLAASGEPSTVLVGWSYGGILAFETAQLVFRTTGRRPAVVLLDIPAPTQASKRSIAEVSDAEIVMAINSHRARQIGRQSTVDLTRLWRDGDDDAMAYVLHRLRADAVVPPSFTTDLATRLASGYRRRMRAVERYRPAPYPGRLILLRASEPEFGDTGILDGVLPAPAHDQSWGWAALAERGCSWQTVDGHHATLLQPPSVEAVARVVRQAARAATEV